MRLRPFALSLAGLILAAGAARAAEVAPIIGIYPAQEYFCTIGGVQDGNLIDADATAPLVKGGETMRYINLTGEHGTATVRGPATMETVCDPVGPQPTIALTDPPDITDTYIAVGGDWPLMPRSLKVQDPKSETYRKALADWLKANGLSSPDAKLIGLIRVDIDGDGSEEVIINGYRGRLDQGMGVEAGDYSVLLMRRIVDGDVKTTLLAGEVFPVTSEGQIVMQYEVVAIADLDGDGRSELVTWEQYYEGAGFYVHRIGADGVGSFVIGCGCGA